MVEIKDMKKKHEEMDPYFFKVDEIERATAIANALNGLTIEEAHQLLEKMKSYVMQSFFRS